MLKFETGDLITLAEEGRFDIIIHGCNCFNTMGAGIAKQIAKRYPEAARVDMGTSFGDINKLGNYTRYEAPNFEIINAYTQYSVNFRYTRDSSDMFEYEAFYLVLKKIARNYGAARYGLPYIGMGLAGGDKDRIIPIIENFANYITSIGGEVTLVKFG